MHTFQNLSHDIEDNDFLFEDEVSLSQNLATLTDNQRRLFLDCDNSNPQEKVAKSHNFGYLVKPNPFQRCSFSEQVQLIDINSENNMCDVSTASSSMRIEPRTINKSRILQKVQAQDKMIAVLHNYCPNHKTFPRGILKRGVKSKYPDSAEKNYRGSTANTNLNDDTMAGKFYWDSIDFSNEELESNVFRFSVFLKIRARHNTDPAGQTRHLSPSKRRVDRVRRLLAENCNYQ